MLKFNGHRRETTASRTDPALKPRLRRRSTFEYVAWIVCCLLALGILISVATNPNFKWRVVARYFTHETIIRGLMLTIFLTVASMILGTLLGLVLAIMRSSSIKPIAVTAGVYITLFRGTPVLVQLIFWFNIAALYPNLTIGIPFTDLSTAIDINALMAPITAALIGLTLNEAAYMAEIIRGGFSSVGKGQIEAADSLGMSGAMKMRKVIIPQAMPSIIPATGNQVIGMFKETSLVSVLGVAELLQSAQLIYARTYETIPLLIVASLWYLVMTLLLSYPQSQLEKKYSRTSSRLPRKAKGCADSTGRYCPMSADGTIHARAIRKSFGPKLVLKDVDLDIASGEICCIIGPSGSGKSTLLRCINGLETVDSGVLKVNGEDLGYYESETAYQALSKKEIAQQRTRIGMVFQQFNLFPNMTARENIMAGPVLVKGADRKESAKRAHELLESVGLSGFGDYYPRSFPAASSSASRSPGPWPWTRRSCSSTNPRAHWIPKKSAKSSQS